LNPEAADQQEWENLAIEPVYRIPGTAQTVFHVTMLVIRRLVDRHRAYTAIFLKGEPPKVFPTSDFEHARIMQIYKQDKPYEGVVNDFSEFQLGTGEKKPNL
jgi:hypothetical protein